ncbi:AAA family ATPase [Moraxella sp. TY6]
MNKKQFPKGIQTFSDIRNGDYYYVDKTPYILAMLKEKYIFLSRPRRFGKSLTLSTIDELFRGNKALFTGLYAEQHWQWDKNYPIIRLNFALNLTFDSEYLQQSLSEQLSNLERQFGMTAIHQTLSGRFNDLIETVATQHQSQVVILVDEYDKPILDNLTNKDEAIKVRDKLRDFYGVIKGADKYIRFAMLTGVSKFSKVNLFSGLNNLTDITLEPEYSALCGYTQAELESVFAPELDGVDLNEVKRWYNGYNWTGESVYNPYDILLFLSSSQKMFKPYWFETGSATFLMDMLANHQLDMTVIKNSLTTDIALSRFDVGDISPIALMFQTGYLTIDKVLQLPFGVNYTLKFPNIEVQQTLNHLVLEKYAHLDDSFINHHKNPLYMSFLNDDLPLMVETVTSFFAGIPYHWHSNNNIAHFEGYWASVFYAYFASIGLHIHVEEPTKNGRMDMTVIFANRVYIFEFKVINNKVQAGSALAQIKAKNYAQKYQGFGQVYEIGVEFDEHSRDITFEF